MDSLYHLLGSMENAEEALENIPLLQPNIVLMDINLGKGMSGIECINILHEKHPNILFMVCTVYENDKEIFEALSAGANGYILKKTTPEQMLLAIKELYEGGAPMSSQIALKIVKAFQAGEISELKNRNETPSEIDKLTNRENEVIKFLSKGLLYKEIASELKISQETVRKHIYHIYEKLHVKNRVEAINIYFNR